METSLPTTHQINFEQQPVSKNMCADSEATLRFKWLSRVYQNSVPDGQNMVFFPASDVRTATIPRPFNQHYTPDGFPDASLRSSGGWGGYAT